MKGFAADVLTANWDAVGLVNDNILLKGGEAHRIDNGAAFMYRAQGTPKGAAFGNSVTEMETLRHPSNRQAHRIFGEMTPADVRRSAARVAAVPDATIRDLVESHGPGTPEQKRALANRLIARRDDVARRAA